MTVSTNFTTYTTLLENKANSNYTNLDISFYQYVLDHITILQNNSRTYYPTADLMARYKYQPEFYLENEISWINPVWLFLVVNGFASHLDFTYPKVKNGINVPLNEYLEQFYEEYQTSSYGCVTYPVGQGLVGPVEWSQTELLSGLHT